MTCIAARNVRKYNCYYIAIEKNIDSSVYRRSFIDHVWLSIPVYIK